MLCSTSLIAWLNIEGIKAQIIITRMNKSMLYCCLLRLLRKISRHHFFWITHKGSLTGSLFSLWLLTHVSINHWGLTRPVTLSQGGFPQVENQNVCRRHKDNTTLLFVLEYQITQSYIITDNVN